MSERLIKRPRGDARKYASWWRARLVWLIACGAVSLVPLVIGMLFLVITGQPFRLILSSPSIPAIGVIWCGLTVYNILTLQAYKRRPFLLFFWISALAALAALAIASTTFLVASGLPWFVGLVNLLPVAAAVAASLWAQRFVSVLETRSWGAIE